MQVSSMSGPVISAINHAPRDFQSHLFEMIYELQCPPSDVWTWISKQHSFEEMRPFLCHLEFNGPGIKPGVLHLHQGPFYLLAGTIGKMKTSAYRDLHYFYGSHILGIKWIRPVRMQCWVAESPKGSTLKVHFESQVRSVIKGPFNFFQKCFWKYFGWNMRRSLRRNR